MVFLDRKNAGRKLTKALSEYTGESTLVLALPRGGVPVGYEIANGLSSRLDTVVARKIGAPGNPEFAVGAIAPGIVLLDIPRAGLEEIIREEKMEMRRRMEKYKSGSYSESLKPAVVIVIDDGIATGRTARFALMAARKKYPDSKLVFAAPVGAPDSVAQLREYADDVVCLETPSDFGAVGEWYEQFDQTTDKEVIELLERQARQ